MKTLTETHPWTNSLKIVNQEYLIDLGVNLDGISEDTMSIVEESSRKAVIDYAGLGGRPPLLKCNQILNTEFVPIPKDLILEKHCNCDECPKYIKEVVPCQFGCQLNCQYCLSVANTSIQKEVKIYDDYANWFRNQLRVNRAKSKAEFGRLYYLSPKTEAFSPQLIKLGLIQQILEAFEDHVLEEQKRLGGICPDTLLIITKAGKQDLLTPGPNGDTILKLLRKIPDNVQVCGSFNYLNGDSNLREALEPGARCVEDRFELMRTLQNNNIQASGLLFQPIFPPFLPDDDYYEMLRNYVGVKKMHIDVLTSNIRSLAVVMQIIGWYYPEAEKMMWDLYLPQEGPEKSGNRKSISAEKLGKIIQNIMTSARKSGIDDFTYCRLTQKAVGLPPRPKNEECMSFIKPTPENIRNSRQRQILSPGRD